MNLLGAIEDDESEIKILENKYKLDNDARKVGRKAVITEYMRGIHALYKEFVAEIMSIGPKLGTEIIIKPETIKQISDSLSLIRDLDNQVLELSLIGFYQSPAVIISRELFISELRSIQKTTNNVSGFENIGKIINDILEHVNKYATYMKTAPSALSAEDIKLDTSLRSSITYEYQKAVAALSYFMYIANVKKNLKYTGDDIKNMKQDHNTALGDAVAGQLDQVKKEHRRKQDKPINEGGLGGDKPPDAFDDDQKAEWGRVKLILAEEYKCKADFYKTIEALDVYLREFTDGIVNNPADVKSIQSALTGVNVNTQWYSTQTGDNLVSLFESMANIRGSNSTVQQYNADHYYGKIQQVLAAGTHEIGMLMPISMAAYSDLKNRTTRLLESFHALKNIMSAFASIGNRFDNKPVAGYMPIVAMYKNFVRYLIYSTFSCGLRIDLINPGTQLAVTLLNSQVPLGEPEDAYSKLYISTITRRNDNNLLIGNWSSENEYFVHAIKAIGAKILAVIGVYDLLERPEPLNSITNIRTILGGYQGIPDIIDDAIESYFRIPRLIEFYKHVFDFDPTKNTQISMLPEISSIFDELIKLIFTRTSTDIYLESEVKDIVAEINKIHREYNGDLGEMTRELVFEVNHRYGVVKREDHENFTRLIRQRSDNAKSRYRQVPPLNPLPTATPFGVFYIDFRRTDDAIWRSRCCD